MDPFTIATTVTKLTSTCLTTGMAIYDLSCKYKDAPRTLIIISSEISVISASLSQLQALILSQKNPEKLLRSRPEIAATLDTSLTGCMVLFSCLDEEVREVSRHVRGLGNLSWVGRVKTVWKQAKFQELLDAIRGQQVAINTLMQLLQMDSLAEITQLLRQKGPELRRTIERTESLRYSHPSVKVAESIYSPEDRGSVYSSADSIMASSELEFDFDDIIVNSAAYRRALAAARHQHGTFQSPQPTEVDGDLIDFSDSNTIRRLPLGDANTDMQAISEDLLGIRFSIAMDDPILTPERYAELPLDEARSDAPQPRVVEAPGIQKPNTEVGLGSLSSSATPIPGASTLTDELDFTRSSEVLEVQSPLSGTRSPTASPSSALSTREQSGDSPYSPASSVGSAKDRPQQRVCHKCNKVMTGQFVRALGNTYHLECFNCNSCDKIVATKFLPVPDKPPNQVPFCERCYFRRLDLLCASCGEALRGSYITALDRKYHVEHFTCTACPHVFGALESYYEHDGGIYCLEHYSLSGAKLCTGCTLPILKQFVEIHRNGSDQIWHPECYSIHKFWNVKMAKQIRIRNTGGFWIAEDGQRLDSVSLAHHVGSAEAMIADVWSTLSTYEESMANGLSRVSCHVSSNLSPLVPEIALMLSKVGVIFRALELVDQRRVLRGLTKVANGRDAKLLCKKIVALMQYVAESHETKDTSKDETQALLSLIIGLAHRTKMLIRIGLTGSCDSVHLLNIFLTDMSAANFERDLHFYQPRMSTLVARSNDNCGECDKAVEDACFMSNSEPMHLWHIACLRCSRCRQTVASEIDKLDTTPNTTTPPLECRSCGTVRNKDVISVTRLSNYAHLLWVAQARLMAATQCDPATLLDVHVNQPDNNNTGEPADAAEGANDEPKKDGYQIPKDRLGSMLRQTKLSSNGRSAP
ncbi:hypothetical protein LTR17_008315 [Elasticomyces elasticus]|nr:hypothetical protein LTR17_008315 [Elasticomyces elasticus]